MLMFDKKKAITAILGENSPGVGVKGEEEGSSALSLAANEFITAVHDKDAARVAAAFKAMFAACEAEPHYEGSHEED